jgi:hypothetical protein
MNQLHLLFPFHPFVVGWCLYLSQNLSSLSVVVLSAFFPAIRTWEYVRWPSAFIMWCKVSTTLTMSPVGPLLVCCDIYLSMLLWSGMLLSVVFLFTYG